MAKCQHCGRTLTRHERYCYHCEQDVSKMVDEEERPRIPTPQPYRIKEDAQKFAKLVKKFFSKKKKAIEIPAYCVKCKKKVIMQNPKEYIMKNKTRAYKGTCPACSRKVFRIVARK